MNPAWRTDTVVGICTAMREARDHSACPILADALQDADCDDADLLARLRNGPWPWAEGCALVACIYSADGAESVRWLREFAQENDCPGYVRLFNAATGRHDLNDGGDGYTYSRSGEWEGEYLHFNGSDAHGAIPDNFWHHVEVVSGMVIHLKPQYFSCSC